MNGDFGMNSIQQGFGSLAALDEKKKAGLAAVDAQKLREGQKIFEQLQQDRNTYLGLAGNSNFPKTVRKQFFNIAAAADSKVNPDPKMRFPAIEDFDDGVADALDSIGVLQGMLKKGDLPQDQFDKLARQIIINQARQGGDLKETAFLQSLLPKEPEPTSIDAVSGDTGAPARFNLKPGEQLPQGYVLPSQVKNIPVEQNKLSTQAAMFTFANRNIGNLLKSGYDPTQLTSVLNRLSDDTVVSDAVLKKVNDPNTQMFFNQARILTAAVNRKESGAAITIGEIKDAFQRFIPLAGESPEAVTLKNETRGLYEDQFLKEANAGLFPFQQSVSKEAIDKRVEKASSEVKKVSDKTKSLKINSVEDALKLTPEQRRARIQQLQGKK